MHSSHAISPWTSERSSKAWPCILGDSEFSALAHSFSRHGGLSTAGDVLLMMRSKFEQPLSRLARWMVDRSIVHFEWRSQTLIPLFQFDANSMNLWPTAHATALELSPFLDDIEVATWFVTPNVWTFRLAPLEVMRRDAAAVLSAARSDRFIALGW